MGIKLFLISLLIPVSLFSDNFLKEQNRYKRVREARVEKIDSIKKLFKEKKIDYPAKIYLRAFKKEKKLQLFALKNKTYELIKEYPFCMLSGELGPKRKQGDYQVPEGFYFLNHFNPYSNFHLSLGVSYPNKADKINKTAKDAGGAIYIHGNCVSIGCIPITDNLIKELYIIAVDAKDKKQNKINIDIYPCDFKTDSCKKELKKYPEHLEFWDNLKKGYEYFEQNKKLPKISITNKGFYKI